MNLSSLRTFVALLALAAVPAFAVNRVLNVEAPPVVKPGTFGHVIVSASTDATDGEQIGFLHSEYSKDGGKTWVPVYAEKVGKSGTRSVDFQAGADGSKILVRVRVAFRGGKAGDVDVAGMPIAWAGTWATWEAPPAKTATISVNAK